MNNTISAVDELPLWSAPFGIILLDKIDYVSGHKVLDIGFGTGFPILELAQRFGKKSEIVGIDPWEEAHEQVTMKCKMNNIQNVNLHIGYAEELPFEKSDFDLVVSNNGLNNVKDIDKVLAEIYRVMNTKAKLIFTVNLPETMHEFYSVFENVLSEMKLPDVIIKLKVHIASKRKSIEKWISLLREFNFRIRNVDEKSFSLKYADASTMFEHHFIKTAFIDNWIQIIPDEFKSAVFNEIEQRLNTQAKESNGLELSIPFACFTCTKVL